MSTMHITRKMETMLTTPGSLPLNCRGSTLPPVMTRKAIPVSNEATTNKATTRMTPANADPEIRDDGRTQERSVEEREKPNSKHSSHKPVVEPPHSQGLHAGHFSLVQQRLPIMFLRHGNQVSVASS
jgi:hypothetical protein